MRLGDHTVSDLDSTAFHECTRTARDNPSIVASATSIRSPSSPQAPGGSDS